MRRSIAVLIAAQILLLAALGAYVVIQRQSALASYVPLEPPMSRMPGIGP